ncbi:MAG: 50S ribosomal protein L6 [Chloroflexi bacterium]|nr:50S ribosomal protein L6 [Chloroflexota bacterium]
MSRIGKQPIELPKGVSATINKSEVTVKGPKGELTRRFDPDMTFKQEDGHLIVERPTDQRHHRALHGLTRALLANMVTGVSEGYEIRLEIRGTGYRAEMQGQTLKLALGFSHDVLVEPPPELSFQVEDRGALIIIQSIDKELIGQVAADIRGLRPPEPYKGKGVRYLGEYVRQKEGKAGKVGG